MRVTHVTCVLLLLSSFAFAQGSHKVDQVIDRNGKPGGGATIRVCDKHATGAAGACTPLAPIFTDQDLGSNHTKANPITADSLGNYDYYTLSGPYVVDICFAGQCTRFNDYVTPAGSIPPSAFSLAPFLDDGATDGIVGVYSAQRKLTLIRIRVRGDKPWVACSTAPVLTLTIPGAVPAADTVYSLPIQSAVVPNGGTAKDNVLSASMTFNQALLPQTEAVFSFIHGAGCSQRPAAVYATLEFDGDR